MVAGISGTGAGSGAAEGEDDENEGRLMLLHAPRKTASIAAIPRLAAVRTPPDPTMFIPKQIRGPPRPAAKRNNPDLATTSCKIRRRIDVVSQSILYEPHQRLLNLVCLTGSPQGHIPQSRSWHSKHPIAKNTIGCLAAPNTPRIHGQFRQQIDQRSRPPKEPSWLKPNFARCMTVSWSSASMLKIRPKAASSFPTPPRKSPRRAKSRRWARAAGTRPAS